MYICVQTRAKMTEITIRLMIPILQTPILQIQILRPAMLTNFTQNWREHCTDLTSTTCNNGFKIVGMHFRSNQANYFFFNRIVNIWNSLPAQIVNSNTIESFNEKKLISIYN